MFRNDDIKSPDCTWHTEEEAIWDIRDTGFMVSSGDTFGAIITMSGVFSAASPRCGADTADTRDTWGARVMWVVI